MAQKEEFGTIYSIGEVVTNVGKNGSAYSNQDIVIEQFYSGMYGESYNYYKLSVPQKMLPVVTNFAVGDKVMFTYYLKGVLYTKKDGTGEDVFMKCSLATISAKEAYKPEYSTSGKPTEIRQNDPIEDGEDHPSNSNESDDLPF